LTPSETAAAIEALLIDHGYPPDKVKDWWQERLYSKVMNDQVWMLGETHSRIWRRGGPKAHAFLLEFVRAGYARSEASMRATLDSPEEMAELRAKIAELDAMYPKEP
jgi:hypothetical protein